MGDSDGDGDRDRDAPTGGGHRRTTKGLGRWFALRGEGAVIHTLNGHQRGYQGRASLTFYFHHTFSGPFLESATGFRKYARCPLATTRAATGAADRTARASTAGRS